MGYLPKKTLLGNIEIIEIYDFYDQPCLFLCKNKSGQNFLSLWIDELSDKQVWLYLPISKWRLREIFERSLDLKSAFQTSEDQLVYKVLIADDNESDEVVRVDCFSLTDEELPTAGEYIEISEDLIFETHENIRNRAISCRKEAIDLSFHFNNQNKTEAPLEDLSNVLGSLQKMIDALGQLCLNQVTLKGSVPNSIRRETQLSLVGVYHGSFGVQIKSICEPDLWNNSLAKQSVEKFVELIKIGNQPALLRSLLLQIQPRAASRYKIFMQNLIHAKSDINLAWSSPSNQEIITAYLNLSDIQNIISVITEVEEQDPKQYNIIGELIGVHKRNKTFEIFSYSENQKFSGRILDSALSIAEQATISKYYEATIIEKQELLPTGEEFTKYNLLNLKLIEN